MKEASTEGGSIGRGPSGVLVLDNNLGRPPPLIGDIGKDKGGVLLLPIMPPMLLPMANRGGKGKGGKLTFRGLQLQCEGGGRREEGPGSDLCLIRLVGGENGGW